MQDLTQHKHTKSTASELMGYASWWHMLHLASTACVRSYQVVGHTPHSGTHGQQIVVDEAAAVLVALQVLSHGHIGIHCLVFRSKCLQEAVTVPQHDGLGGISMETSVS